jgi:hypothetical protein
MGGHVVELENHDLRCGYLGLGSGADCHRAPERGEGKARDEKSDYEAKLYHGRDE